MKTERRGHNSVYSPHIHTLKSKFNGTGDVNRYYLVYSDTNLSSSSSEPNGSVNWRLVMRTGRWEAATGDLLWNYYKRSKTLLCLSNQNTSYPHVACLEIPTNSIFSTEFHVINGDAFLCKHFWSLEMQLVHCAHYNKIEIPITLPANCPSTPLAYVRRLVSC